MVRSFFDPGGAADSGRQPNNAAAEPKPGGGALCPRQRTLPQRERHDKLPQRELWVVALAPFALCAGQAGSAPLHSRPKRAAQSRTASQHFMRELAQMEVCP